MQNETELGYGNKLHLLDDDIERLYFVVETKSSLFTDALRPAEQAKIECGMAHFAALGDDVQFIKATKMRDVEGEVFRVSHI